MRIKRPNIFNYATSELSQDAFISWFMVWADKEYADVDRNLNELAKAFIRKLLGDDKIQIETVQVRKQWKHTDVSAVVNDEYFIVIKDKKGTQEHSDQLKRYLEEAEKEFKDKIRKIRLVYFNMEEQANYENVEESGFSVFGRKHMLEVLKPYFENSDSYNHILTDYYEHLGGLDWQFTQAYREKPVDKWYWHCWVGFYQQLLQHEEFADDGDWQYVANPGGGFLGFWWYWHAGRVNGIEFEYYLQIEQHKMIFRIYADEQQQATVRDVYRNCLFQKAKDLNISVKPYGRISKSGYFGVAILNGDYRAQDDKGLLDFDKTLGNLRQYMHLLDEVEKEIESL